VKRIVALVAALALLQGALELHGGGAAHLEKSAGETLLAQEASHPASPLHLESSDPVRAHGCSTCALAGHSKGVSPAIVVAHRDARDAAPCLGSDLVAPSSPLRLAAAPRGPPLA
jgi:hypothetical protein